MFRVNPRVLFGMTELVILGFPSPLSLGAFTRLTLLSRGRQVGSETTADVNDPGLAEFEEARGVQSGEKIEIVVTAVRQFLEERRCERM